MRLEVKNGNYILLLFAEMFTLTTAKDSHVLHEVDICNEKSKFQCKDEEIISVVDLGCETGSFCTQFVNKTVFELCQGRQTCADLGLRQMLVSECGKDTPRKNSINLRFNCLPGSATSCLLNICTDSQAELLCPNGSAIHIRRLICDSILEKCPLSSHKVSYVCNGVTRCAATRLKAIFLQYCENEDPWKRNVFVEYMCVPEQLVENTCTSGMFRVLKNDVGILRSPNFYLSSRYANASCKWLIEASEDDMVKVTVHLIRFRHADCDPNILRISFVECTNHAFATRSLCDVDSFSIELVSCGQVEITSVIPLGEEIADKFIVSYQKTLSSDPGRLPPSLPRCKVLPEKNMLKPQIQPAVPNLHSSRTSPRPISVARNYGPGDGMFEYRDASYEEAGAVGSENNVELSTLSKQLRLMILYIFFGVVILVLLVALIAVIISYRRISKVQGPRSDYWEKTALWQHHDEIALDTFQNQNMGESIGNQTSGTTCGLRSSFDSDKVVATVHHDNASGPDQLGFQLVYGNGMSTFLADKHNIGAQNHKDYQIDKFFLNDSSKEVLSNHYSSDYSCVEDCRYFEMKDTHHYDIPANSDHNIYEDIDLGSSSSIISRGKKPDGYCPIITPVDGTEHEGEYHELPNYDWQLQATPQHTASTDLHYCINDDEYAIVSKTKSVKPLNSTEILHGDRDATHV